MYTPLVLDHFRNPRNTGSLPAATAIGRAENPGCGDVVELSLHIAGDLIVEARFRGAGCVPTIACASRLTELIHGATIPDALGMGREKLIESVGGVPEASLHAVQLSLDALGIALGKR
jgi:nitrogen fixation protein NifU and related proteins